MGLRPVSQARRTSTATRAPECDSMRMRDVERTRDYSLGVLYRRIIYLLWALQTTYLTLTAIGVKRDTRPHLGQSFSLLAGLVLAFSLPRSRPFRWTDRPPAGPVTGVLGVAVCLLGMGFLI
jgi:hypothetical protein